ncbi:response regulator [Dyella terrae]|uniref:response regulator n=1 Tax=Dyella terrae TaxID=522259 RepID=UPI001EFC3F22|nr:response regulator transcription factor [Dyella terrae]
MARRVSPYLIDSKRHGVAAPQPFGSGPRAAGPRQGIVAELHASRKPWSGGCRQTMIALERRLAGSADGGRVDSTEEHIAFRPALIVEDDEATQHRLARLLLELVGTADDVTVVSSVAAAKAVVSSLKPRLALVDIGLPDGSGLELIDWVETHHPNTTTVAISAWGHEEVALAALRSGAVGYLMKERDDVELRAALQSIRRGGALIDPLLARRILAHVSLASRDDATPALATTDSPGKRDISLSERESEILQFVARGFSNREIANLTSLSRFTIEGYTKSIYRKLAVSSRTAAVFEAKAMGLL